MNEKAIQTEEYTVSGDKLVAKVKELVHEGNIRRLIIKNEEGETIVAVPLTMGVGGILLMPSLAAIGAVAALVTDCTILVEKEEEKQED